MCSKMKYLLLLPDYKLRMDYGRPTVGRLYSYPNMFFICVVRGLKSGNNTARASGFPDEKVVKVIDQTSVYYSGRGVIIRRVV